MSREVKYEASIETYKFDTLDNGDVPVTHSIIFYRITDTGERVEVSASEVPAEVALYYQLKAESTLNSTNTYSE